MSTIYGNVILEGTFAADQRVGLTGTPYRALHVVINVTSLEGGTPQITPKIQLPNGVGGYYDVLVGVPINTVSETVLKIGLDYAASAGVVAKDIVSPNMSLLIDHADTDDITYTVAVNPGW
ncbi:MAG: hypothetical protein ACWGQW_01215 [bacterium]